MSFAGTQKRVNPLSVLSQMDCFGHSQMAGAGPVDPQNRYSTKVARELHIAERNWARGGAILTRANGSGTNPSQGDGGYPYILQLASRSNGAEPRMPGSQLVMLHHGINDLATLGPANINIFRQSLKTSISAILSTSRFGHTDASIAWGAGYSNVVGVNNNFGSGFKSGTNVAGASTITVPTDFPGGVVAIAFPAVGDTTGAVFNITVDGVAAGSIDTRQNAVSNIIVGSTNNVLVWRSGVLAAGGHSIVITPTNMVGSHYVNGWWIEGAYPNRPLIVLIKAFREYNYSLWDTWTYNAAAGLGDATIHYVNDIIDEMTALFGQGVYSVDIDSAINKVQTNFIADAGHLNERGQALAAESIVDQLTRAVAIDTKQAAYPLVSPRSDVVDFALVLAEAAAVVWTNQPSILTEFNGTRSRTSIDLSPYNEIRLVANVLSGGAGAAVLAMQYSENAGTSWRDLGATLQPQIALNSVALKASSWIPIESWAKREVWLRLVGQGGDGAIDPSFGRISFQVR